MNKFLRISFFAIGIGILGATVTVGNANAQILTEVMRRMDLNNRTLQSLQASVTMEKYNPQLDTKDVSVGSTSYLPKSGNRPMYVRINWTKPMDEQISVIGDRYELYRARLNQVIQGKVSGAKNNASAGGALGFMSMSKNQLKENYTVQMVAEELLGGTVKTAHLLLTPKAATSYKTAELWVDSDGMPRQAKITEQNNDTTTVLLENIQKNVTIKASAFVINYDKKKVRIIQG